MKHSDTGDATMIKTFLQWILGTTTPTSPVESCDVEIEVANRKAEWRQADLMRASELAMRGINPKTLKPL